VLAVAAFAAIGGSARADDEAVALLERMRDPESATTFAGVVEVRWRDDGVEHVEKVGARALEGSFVVGSGDDRIVGEGVVRWIGGTGLSPAWSDVAVGDLPAIDAAWDVDVVGRREIAGRTARVVAARDDDGRVRARFAVDEERGQLLSREVLDEDGEVVRGVGFVHLVTEGVAPAVPQVPGALLPTSAALDEVPDGFVGPDGLAGAYQLLGRYQEAGGVVQLYYHDGLFSVSLFEQKGRLDWDALPEGGRQQRIDGVRTHSYATAAGTVTVWADGGLVLTCVADGPPGTTTDVVRDLSLGGRDLLEEIADFVLGPFGWE
jgi:hypothetical protein